MASRRPAQIRRKGGPVEGDARRHWHARFGIVDGRGSDLGPVQATVLLQHQFEGGDRPRQCHRAGILDGHGIQSVGPHRIRPTAPLAPDRTR
jgi:hypothetical protein